jgi:hypothetical protein
LTLTSAPLDNKYSAITFSPLSEAPSQTLINLILMKLNIYSLKRKGIDPTLLVTLTSAPFDNRIITISL